MPDAVYLYFFFLAIHSGFLFIYIFLCLFVLSAHFSRIFYYFILFSDWTCQPIFFFFILLVLFFCALLFSLNCPGDSCNDFQNTRYVTTRSITQLSSSSTTNLITFGSLLQNLSIQFEHMSNTSFSMFFI